MNLRILAAIVRKDIVLFFRNRFFALITGLALVAYAAIYYLMPASVDEKLELGFYAEVIPVRLAEELEAEGVELVTWESIVDLEQAVAAGDIQAGVALPDDMEEKILSGEKPIVQLFLRSDLPSDIREIYGILIRELGYLISGQSLALEVREVTLGIDRAGMQIPIRDRIVPLTAVLILAMETMGLATLIGTEIQEGTLGSLMVTPLSVEGFFLGKGITGIALSFGQAAILLGAIGGLQREIPLLFLSLFLGAVLVTGIGFLMGSAVRDVLSILPWSILMFIILGIPAIDIVLPGLLTSWIKFIPSYYLVDILYPVITQGAGWAEVGQNLWILLASGVLSLGIGALVLRRQMR